MRISFDRDDAESSDGELPMDGEEGFEDKNTDDKTAKQLAEHRVDMEKKPAFLFQRIANNTKREKKINLSLQTIPKEDEVVVKEDGMKKSLPPGDHHVIPPRVGKFLSACVLVSIPLVVGVYICLVVLLFTTVPTIIPIAPMVPSTQPSMKPSPMPLKRPTFDGGDDELQSTSVNEQVEEKPQLIGLINAPFDTDELVLLVETDSDLETATERTTLDLAEVTVTTTEGGDTVYCNVKVDGVPVLVECLANEDVCRVYVETNSDTCDVVESASRSLSDEDVII